MATKNFVPRATGEGQLGTSTKKWKDSHFSGTGSFGHIIVDGNITASGEIRADSFKSVTGGDTIDFNDNLDVAGAITFSGNISGSSTSTGSFGHGFIDNKLGVGISAPVQPLHVFSSGNGGIEIDSSGGAPTLFLDIPGNEQGRIYFQEDDTLLGGLVYETTGTDFLSFRVGGSSANVERLRITGDNKISGSALSTGSFGRVQIKPSGDARLDIVSTTFSELYFNDASTAGVISYNHGNDQFTLFTGGGIRQKINSTTTEFVGANYKISGSFTSTGSFGSVVAAGALDVTGVSNFASDITTDSNAAINLGNNLNLGASSVIAKSGNNNIDFFTNSSNRLRIEGGGDVEIFNDLTVGGTITAQKFATELVSGSIIYQSGSTKFGDTMDDVANFTGSLIVSGAANTLISLGNVGIGTTGPQSGFDKNITIEGASPALILKDSTSSNQATQFYTIFSSNGNIKHYYDDSHDLIFATTADVIGNSETERMRIDSSGNVGIGTNAPGAKLEVVGNISGSATSTGSFGTVFIPNQENLQFGSFQTRIRGDNSNNNLTFNTNNTERVRIDDNGMGIGGDPVSGASLTTYSDITIDETGGTSNSAVLNLKADRASEGQDSGEIRFFNNNSDYYVAIHGERGSADTKGDLVFVNRGASLHETMRLDEDGNVSFGVANAKISGSSTSTGSFGQVRTADGFSVGPSASPGFTVLTSTGHLMIGDGASSVQMQKDLIPDGNGSQDLGSTTRNFGQIFAQTKVTGSAISTGSFAHLSIPGQAVVGLSTIKTITSGSSLQINDQGLTSVGVDYRHVTNDVGKGFTQRFLAGDQGGNVVEYGRIKTEIINRGSGGHIGKFIFSPTISATATEVMNIGTGGVEVTRGNISGSATSTGSFGKIDTANITENSSGVQIGTAGNVTDVPLRVNNKILIHQDSGGAGDSELHFDRRHDGADARIKAVAGGSGAMGTELHFVTTLAGTGEQTVLQLDDNGHIYSDLANTKISGSATSTGSFGSMVIGGQNNANAQPGADTLVVQDGMTIFNTGTGRLNFSDGAGSGDESYKGVIKYSHSSNVLTFAANAVDRVSLNANGVLQTLHVSGSATSTGSFGHGHFADRVGIGTTNPDGQLHVVGGNGNSLTLDNGGEQFSQLNLANNGTHKAFMTYDNTNKVIAIGAQGNLDGFDYIGFRPKGSTDVMAISGSSVGIGETSPEARVHVKTADSGVTPNAVADDLFVENNTHGGITIGTPNSVSGYLFFADPQDNAGAGLVYNHSADELAISAAGTTRITVSATDVEFAAHVLPDGDNDADLGSASKRWANLFVGDLELSNEGSGGNDVDGTEGKWTIQEGEENLYLLNRKNNKKYKFLLEEIE